MRSTKGRRKAVILLKAVPRRRRASLGPKGPVREMTPAWKKTVRLRLKEMGKDIPWLGRQVGLSRSGAYKLFAEDARGNMVQTGCAEVPAICKLLDVPPPLVDTPSVPEPRDQRLQELLREAPDALKDAVIEILSRALQSKDGD